MAKVRIDIDGLDEAMDYVEKLADAADAMAKANVGLAVSGRARLYSYGIEYGRKRSGELARAAGGVFFVTKAVEGARPKLDDVLAKALEDGKGQKAMADAAQALQVEAQQRVTAVRTGNLRRSIHAFTSERAGLGRA